MRKLLLILPLILFSCKKTTEKTNSDTQDNKEDSLGVELTIKTGESGHGYISPDLPLIVDDYFEEEHIDSEKAIIKIKLYKSPEIKATIIPEHKDMNIQFIQVKLPDRSVNGPFGKEINYKTPLNGEVILVIGKNEGSSANPKGKFSVKIE